MNIVKVYMIHSNNLGPIALDKSLLNNRYSSYLGNLNIGHINAAFKEYFANPTDETWKSFCKLRNKAKSVLRKHHRKYGDRLFTGVNNCYLWSRVSKLVCVGNIL